MASSWFSTATRTLSSGFWSGISHFFSVTFNILWDNGSAFLNLITPKKRVIALNLPEYIPPASTDSRSACPALNALSNHGILPRNGRDITFRQMADEVHTHYNFSRSFCYYVCMYIARVLRRNYDDTFDLSDISVHNGIEHDGSITRYDTAQQPDQSAPAEDLINDIISASKDGKTLTSTDVSGIITRRFMHSRRTNGQFSLTTSHIFFAASNASTLLLIFGGRLEDIKPFLLEERLPEGWSTKFRARLGLTMTRFNSTATKVLLGIDPLWMKTKSVK